MKFLPYVLKHLRRSWVRTLSTIIGMALCIFLICTLQTVLDAIRKTTEAANPSRVVTRHAVSLTFNMPLAYKPRIQTLPGVRRVAVSNWFGGVYRDMKDFFPNFAVESEDYFPMYPEYVVAPAEYGAYLADMQGALVGRDLAEKYGFNIGDTFQMESIIPPYRVSGPLKFNVRGIYDAPPGKRSSVNTGMMFFHFKYLNETIRGQRGAGAYSGAGTFSVQVTDPGGTAAVMRAIDTNFENSDVQTKTETEGAFLAGFIALTGNLVGLLNGVGLAVGFTILLVTANTMSMAVRERRTEIAVLKTLGFSSRLVMALIIGEAFTIAAVSGLIGVGLARGAVGGLASLPFMGLLLGNFPALEVSPVVGSLTFLLAVGLGTAAGLVPAMGAYRTRITDALRSV
ncbi:MAG: ABC transporter permease [Vicinamibacterales bacterium]